MFIVTKLVVARFKSLKSLMKKDNLVKRILKLMIPSFCASVKTKKYSTHLIIKLMISQF